MKNEFMRIGGAKTEKEFYEMYPTEEAFLIKHGGAINKLMARGGEAYPQTATMDNFFSYGVPPGPSYYSHGGSAYPMAQSEDQFFAPYYSDVYNPYNKEHGGSHEVYNQAPKYGNPGQSKSFLFMEDGGTNELAMGVNNRTGEFLSRVRNGAAIAANREIIRNAESSVNQEFNNNMMRYGGLPKAQTGLVTPPAGGYSNAGVYAEQNPLTSYQEQLFKNDPNALSGYLDSAYRTYYDLQNQDKVVTQDPAYAELAKAYGFNMPQANTPQTEQQQTQDKQTQDPQNPNLFFVPRSSFNVRHKVYNQDGMFKGMSNNTLAGGLGAEGLNKLGLTQVDENAPETALGRFFRPTKRTYRFDGTPQSPDATGAGTDGTQNSVPPQPGANPQTQQMGQRRPKSNFFGRPDNDPRWQPENNATFFSSKTKNVEFPMGESNYNPEGYKDLNRNSDFRNYRATEKLNKIGDRLDRNYQRETALETLYDQPISDRMSKLRERDERRYNRKADKFNRDQYTAPTFDDGGYYATGGPYQPLNIDITSDLSTANPDKIKEKELSGLRQQWEKRKDDPMATFYKDQMAKNVATNFMNQTGIQQRLGMSDPYQQYYAGVQDMYTADGTQKGTFDPLNVNNFQAPYSKSDIRYDQSATDYNFSRMGGSIKEGDIRDMTPDEIAEFVAMGGEIEYL